MTEQRWKISRMGLVNFWYYTNQIFEFSDGRILLRGGNGTGKSVTMQSLLPVLLDGNINANRLDSFGSVDRHMEEYLLGEESVNGKTSNTGYLFVEYQRDDEFLTTGIGMTAKRGGNIKKWYFTIEDGRRIGKDFELTEKLSADSFQPLPKKQLDNRLGNGGRTWADERTEYEKYVNSRIFGFDTLKDFDDCIRLLIALRNPKLNKDYGPKKIIQMLSDSLPTLNQEELKPISETLDNLTEARENLEENEQRLKSIKPVVRAFQKTQDEQLSLVASRWLDNVKAVDSLNETLEQAKNDIQQQQTEQEQLTSEVQKLEQEKERLGLELDTFKRSETFDLISEAKRINRELDSITNVLARHKNNLTKSIQSVKDIKIQIELSMTKLGELSDDDLRFRNELENSSKESGFYPIHQQNMQDFVRDTEDFTFNLWRQNLRGFENHLLEVLQLLRDLSSLEKNLKSLNQRLNNMQEKINVASENLSRANVNYQTEKKSLKVDINTYSQKTPFTISTDKLENVYSNIDNVFDEVPLRRIYEPIQMAADDYRHSLKLKREPIVLELEDTKQRISDNEQAINDLKNGLPETPARTDRQKLDREKLQDSGVKFASFYECVDFKDSVSEQQRNKLENSLLNSNILDSLISDEKLQLTSERQLIINEIALGETLSEYLKPDVTDEDAVAEQTIISILNSIGVSDDKGTSTSVSDDGHYYIGIISGVANYTYQASYIGTAARERRRQERILELQNELNALSDAKQKFEKQISSVEDQIKQITAELDGLPNLDNLSEAFDKRDMCQKQLDHVKQEMNYIKDEYSQVSKQKLSSKQNINAKTAEDDIELSESGYRDAQESVQRYQNILNDWQQVLNRIKLNKTQQKRFEIDFDNANKRVDSDNEDVNEDQKRQSGLSNELEANRERQSSSDFKQQQERIKFITKRQPEIDKLLEEDHHQKSMLEADLREQYRLQISVIKKLKFAEPYTDLIKTTFIEIYKSIYGIESNDWYRQANELLKGWRLDFDRIKDLSDRLTNQVNLHMNDLSEFQLRLESNSILNIPEWISEFTENNQIDAIQAWKNLNTQRLAKVNIDNKEQLVTSLQTRLEDEIKRGHQIQSEKEHDLFRSVIFDSVGQVIRGLIRDAKSWTKQMRSIMDQQESQSGLKLRINWRPKPGDFEDTTEITGLLEKDPNTIEDADVDKIQKFLLRKIESEKQVTKSSNRDPVMFDILRNVLDYR